MTCVARGLFLLIIGFAWLPGISQACSRSCGEFAERVISCQGIAGPFEGLIKTYCKELCRDYTRYNPAWIADDWSVSKQIDSISCRDLSLKDPFDVLEAKIKAMYAGVRDPSRGYEKEKARRWENIEVGKLPRCDFSSPVVLAETQACVQYQPATRDPSKPDLILLGSFGRRYGITYFYSLYKRMQDELARRFNLYSYAVEAYQSDLPAVGRLRYRYVAVIRSALREHPEARIMVTGFSYGASQLNRALGELLIRDSNEALRPDLALLFDVKISLHSKDPIYALPVADRYVAFQGARIQDITKDQKKAKLEGSQELKFLELPGRPCNCSKIIVNNGRTGHPATHLEVPNSVLLFREQVDGVDRYPYWERVIAEIESLALKGL
jgi:hypothetical protein